MQLDRRQLELVLRLILEQSAPDLSVHHMCGYGVWEGNEPPELTNDFLLNMSDGFGRTRLVPDPEHIRDAFERTSHRWGLIYGLDDPTDMWETLEDELTEDESIDVHAIYILMYHLTDERKDDRYFSVTRLSDAIQGFMGSKHKTGVKRYRILDTGGVQTLNTTK